jgi:hypothetical protein
MVTPVPSALQPPRGVDLGRLQHLSNYANHLQ